MSAFVLRSTSQPLFLFFIFPEQRTIFSSSIFLYRNLHSLFQKTVYLFSLMFTVVHVFVAVYYLQCPNGYYGNRAMMLKDPWKLTFFFHLDYLTIIYEVVA